MSEQIPRSIEHQQRPPVGEFTHGAPEYPLDQLNQKELKLGTRNFDRDVKILLPDLKDIDGPKVSFEDENDELVTGARVLTIVAGGSTAVAQVRYGLFQVGEDEKNPDFRLVGFNWTGDQIDTVKVNVDRSDAMTGPKFGRNYLRGPDHSKDTDPDAELPVGVSRDQGLIAIKPGEDGSLVVNISNLSENAGLRVWGPDFVSPADMGDTDPTNGQQGRIARAIGKIAGRSGDSQ